MMVNGRKILRPVLLRPLPEEERHFLEVDARSRLLLGTNDTPTAQLDIIQQSTDVNLSTVSTFSLASYSITHEVPIDHQSTLPFPIVQASNEAPEIDSQASKKEGYVSLVRNLAQNSGIYAIASLASPLINLILAPFLTHRLSHSGYGGLSVLNTAIVLMATITQLGISSAFFRAYNHEYESRKDRLSLLSTVVILLLLVSMPLTVTMLIMAPQLSIILFHDPSFGNAIRLAALVVLVQNFTIPGFSWLRAENHSIVFVVLALVNLLVSLGATIIFVGMFHMGISGSLLATAAGYAIVVICTLPVVLYRSGLHFRLDIAWNLLSFGLPSVSSLVSVWVLQLSDRYLLSYFGSLSETANYTVAYTLGGALAPIAITPFSLAWYAIIYTIAKKKDAARVFQLIFRWYGLILLFTAFALSLIATDALIIFYPPSYHATVPVIPLVATSTMLYGLYNVFTVGIYLKRKTWIGSILATVAALVNVGLNIILIPLYGTIGAAVSTLLAYALLASIAYIVNQRIYPVPFEIYTFLIALLLGIGLYVGSFSLTHFQNIYVVWFIPFIGLGLYSVCLAFLAKVSIRDHWFKRLRSRRVPG